VRSSTRTGAGVRAPTREEYRPSGARYYLCLGQWKEK
jgi:hypothetical protein